MRTFARNLALWCIITLLLIVLFNLFDPHAGGTDWHGATPWLRSWGPFTVAFLFYFLIAIALQHRRTTVMVQRANDIAAVAHADAEQIVTLLQDIKNLQLAAQPGVTARSEGSA